MGIAYWYILHCISSDAELGEKRKSFLFCFKIVLTYLTPCILVENATHGRRRVYWIECVCAQSLSLVWLFATPWTVALQAPLSMVFFRKEYWIELPFPSPGDLPNPWIEPTSLASTALAGGFFTTVPPGKPLVWTKALKKICSHPAPQTL